jgi:DNA-binding SARP family transcriptional activator/TolB-like protein
VIRIHTLGGLAVLSTEGKTLAGAAGQPRRMAVLALLARAGDRGIAREKLLALLWPDADDERGPRALTQACYALRKELGSEDAITGARELRLNPGYVSTDVAEFAAALVRGDNERAAALYAGPFLDSFRLADADEFNRWVEAERGTLARDHARALESLATTALADGRAQDAVARWRELAALDPLNARVAVRLMEAMAAAGDRPGAIRHAHIYELLVGEELDLPPDREVTAFAARLREDAKAVDHGRCLTEPAGLSATVPEVEEQGGASVASSEASLVASASLDVVPSDSPVMHATHDALVQLGTARRSPFPRWAIAAVVIAGLAILGSALFVSSRRRGGSAEPTGDVVAIGRIASHGSDSVAASLASSVADLLATSLARLPDLRLVSQARMLELMRPDDSSGRAQLDAARRAGATEVIDGILYARGGGRLRLDLRLVDLSTGAIRVVRTVEGSDLFALVDSGTVQLSGTLHRPVPHGSIADVTTRSSAAYSLYTEGVHAYHEGANRAALRLFDRALQEDSLFALAAYYGALAASGIGSESWRPKLDHALRLATRAPDRERLIITADWAYRTSSPLLAVVADTLAKRFPDDVDGYLYSGIARLYAGEFSAAAAALEHAVRLDSIALSGPGARCVSCKAFSWLISANELADSGRAAERVAHRWLRIEPGSWPAMLALLDVLERHGRLREADSLLRSSTPPDAEQDVVLAHRIALLLRAGDYENLDRLLRDEVRRGGPSRQADAWWWMAYQLRERGRYSEALAAARQLRRFPDPGRPIGALQSTGVLEATIALDAERPAIASALFDTIARMPAASSTASEAARRSAWALLHRADAQAAAGDSAGLARAADSIQAAGRGSVSARDRRLHHHVRALLLARRGLVDDAIVEYESALYSLTLGYTRTNYELAQLYLQKRRPREAIRVLQPALRGGLEGSNLYVSRTEIHELLAQAFESLGAADSAASHYDIVASAWSAADPSLSRRVERARAHRSPIPAR